MKTVFGAICGLALTGLAATPSAAVPVSLEVIGMPNSVLASSQIDGTEVQQPPAPAEFATGSFLVQNTDTLDEFIAWCIEVVELIASGPAEYETDVTLLSSERETLLSQLFTGFADQTTSDVGAAAFQLAIWEIVEEAPSSSNMLDLDVTDGRFTAASTTAGVIDTANGFLAGLDAFDANFRITYFQNADSQDLISASPIPLPASIFLLGAGIGALAFARRRAQARSVAA